MLFCCLIFHGHMLYILLARAILSQSGCRVGKVKIRPHTVNKTLPRWGHSVLDPWNERVHFLYAECRCRAGLRLFTWGNRGWVRRGRTGGWDRAAYLSMTLRKQRKNGPSPGGGGSSPSPIHLTRLLASSFSILNSSEGFQRTPRALHSVSEHVRWHDVEGFVIRRQ